jgi:hypothetical protein
MELPTLVGPRVAAVISPSTSFVCLLSFVSLALNTQFLATLFDHPLHCPHYSHCQPGGSDEPSELEDEERTCMLMEHFLAHYRPRSAHLPSNGPGSATGDTLLGAVSYPWHVSTWTIGRRSFDAWVCGVVCSIALQFYLLLFLLFFLFFFFLSLFFLPVFLLCPLLIVRSMLARPCEVRPTPLSQCADNSEEMQQMRKIFP